MTQQNTKQVVSNIINGVDLDIITNTVQAITAQPELGKCQFHASNSWLGGSRNASTFTDFFGAGQDNEHKQAFVYHADEPAVLAGNDDHANPVEYLLHALASCVTTSLVAHAAVRGIEIEELESTIEGDIDLNGFLGIDPNVAKGYTDIRINFRVKGNTDEKTLREIAEFSPVYNTITRGANIDIQVECQ